MLSNDKFLKRYRAPTQEVRGSVGMSYIVELKTHMVTMRFSTGLGEPSLIVAMTAEEADQMVKDLTYYAETVRLQLKEAK